MKNIITKVRKFLSVLAKSVLIILILLFFVFEVFTLLEQGEANSPLPPLFGNFEKVRATLSNAPKKEYFDFAIFGDTRSKGTFERIVEELRRTPVDFGVLLGDAFKWKGHHRYFLAECKDEFRLPFPILVVNHLLL